MRQVLAAAAMAGTLAAGAGAAHAQGSGMTVMLEPEVYIAASGGYTQLNSDSGGFNTVGPHFNFGENDAAGFLAAGAVGLANFASIGPVSFRIEAEGFTGTEENVRTGSFPGPPGPATFFYVGTVETRGMMASLWADWQPVATWPVLLSVGAGGGIGWTEIRVNDTVVNAAGTEFTGLWMAGAQATWLIDENWSLSLTGRYIDFGEVSYPLFTNAVGAAAGTYTLDQSAFQALLTVRLRFPI